MERLEAAIVNNITITIVSTVSIASKYKRSAACSDFSEALSMNHIYFLIIFNSVE